MCTWHGHVDGGAQAFAGADLIGMAAPRPHLLLMHVDVEHRVILVKEILHTEHSVNVIVQES